MEKIYTYKITNIINGKYYYGVHKHTKGKDDYLGSGRLIKKAIIKYGSHNFKKDIIEYFYSTEQAYEAEKLLVTNIEVDDDNCYNIALGGKGGWKHVDNKGIPRSEEVKMKISKSEKGKIVSEETRKKLSLVDKIGKANPFFGLKHNKETKEKIRNKLLGRTLSKETKEKISKANKIRWTLYRVNKIMKKRYEENNSCI